MYDSYAAIYDLAGQGRFGEQMARWVLRWLSERDKRPGRVLDLACGTGAAALVFAQAGCEIVGVDSSAAMLDTASAFPAHLLKARAPSAPFAPIDPQNWVNPDNMTWDDFVAPPSTSWSDPARKGRDRNFKIAMVTVDYPGSQASNPNSK